MYNAKVADKWTSLTTGKSTFPWSLGPACTAGMSISAQAGTQTLEKHCRDILIYTVALIKGPDCDEAHDLRRRLAFFRRDMLMLWRRHPASEPRTVTSFIRPHATLRKTHSQNQTQSNGSAADCIQFSALKGLYFRLGKTIAARLAPLDSLPSPYFVCSA